MNMTVLGFFELCVGGSESSRAARIHNKTSGRTPPVKRPVTLDHARRANDVAWSVVAVHYMYNYVK